MPAFVRSVTPLLATPRGKEVPACELWRRETSFERRVRRTVCFSTGLVLAALPVLLVGIHDVGLLQPLRDTSMARRS